MEKEMIMEMVAFASGGLIVFSAIILIQYVTTLLSQVWIGYRMKHKGSGQVVVLRKEKYDQRMESFTYAVNGLSDAFMAMSQPKEKLITEEVSILEQELTGRLCAACDGCAICWNENRMRRQGGIRALLHAVMNHSTKEELLIDPYVENCHQYSNMVEEAL